MISKWWSPLEPFWSSSVVAGLPGFRWLVGFFDGSSSDGGTGPFNVFPVRCVC